MSSGDDVHIITLDPLPAAPSEIVSVPIRQSSPEPRAVPSPPSSSRGQPLYIGSSSPSPSSSSSRYPTPCPSPHPSPPPSPSPEPNWGDVRIVHIPTQTNPRRTTRSSNTPAGRPSNRQSERQGTRSSRRHETTVPNPELKNLCSTLAKLSQQLHVMSQRRIAEKAAANAVDEGAQPEMCPICFEPFHCPGTCTTLCGHVFHRKCLEACLKNSDACPVCRAIVYKAELIDLMSGYAEHIENPETVVDLINESAEDSAALDDAMLCTIQSVRGAIDRSKALDMAATQAEEEQEEITRRVKLQQCKLKARIRDFDGVMAGKVGQLNRRSLRIQKAEETLAKRISEVNEKLCKINAKESDMQILEGELEAKEEELKMRKHELEMDKTSMREKERRMKALQEARKERKSKERDLGSQNRILALENLLRRNGIAVPKEVVDDKPREQELGRDAFKVNLNDEVCVVESPIKKRKVSTSSESSFGSAFGSGVTKPTAYSRPPAPRRKGVGIKSFAPMRRGVQQPGAVARRGLHCTSRK